MHSWGVAPSLTSLLTSARSQVAVAKENPAAEGKQLAGVGAGWTQTCAPPSLGQGAQILPPRLLVPVNFSCPAPPPALLPWLGNLHQLHSLPGYVALPKAQLLLGLLITGQSRLAIAAQPRCAAWWHQVHTAGSVTHDRGSPASRAPGTALGEHKALRCLGPPGPAAPSPTLP